MDSRIERESFKHLAKMCKIQRQIRNCKIEGSIFGLEKYVENAPIMFLISFSQEEKLLKILT
jgi:hypothetical protein